MHCIWFMGNWWLQAKKGRNAWGVPILNPFTQRVAISLWYYEASIVLTLACSCSAQLCASSRVYQSVKIGKPDKQNKKRRLMPYTTSWVHHTSSGKLTRKKSKRQMIGSPESERCEHLFIRLILVFIVFTVPPVHSSADVSLPQTPLELSLFASRDQTSSWKSTFHIWS